MNSIKVYWIADVDNDQVLAGPFGSLDKASLERGMIIKQLYYDNHPPSEEKLTRLEKAIKVVYYQVPVTIEE